MQQCRCNTSLMLQSISRRKFRFLPAIEKFLYLVLARNTMMLQHLIVQFLLCYLLSGGLQEVKSKDIFTLLALKVVDVAYDR